MNERALELTETSDADDELLRVAGQQIRSIRALRGMSRKIVADRADVSERHLAMIEKGTGNVSIRLLGRIATVLDVPVGDLLSPVPSQQFQLVRELLARLSPDEQREAYRLVSARFPESASHRRVALIGLRGAGKSTLGAELARAHDIPFVRLSAQVEQLAGMALPEVHELAGQAGYRRLEEQAVQQTLAGYPAAVIEAGGSIVANAPAYEALLRGAHVVWLQASPNEHMDRVVRQGDLRPMGGRQDAMDDLIAILEERSALYAHANATLDTSGHSVEAAYLALRELTDGVLARIPA